MVTPIYLFPQLLLSNASFSSSGSSETYLKECSVYINYSVTLGEHKLRFILLGITTGKAKVNLYRKSYSGKHLMKKGLDGSLQQRVLTNRSVTRCTSKKPIGVAMLV